MRLKERKKLLEFRAFSVFGTVRSIGTVEHERNRILILGNWMRILRLRYALSLLAAGLALLAGGGLDRALEWTHNRLLSASALIGGEEPPRPLAIDAVVVLGYALSRDGSPSAALEHRVRGAVREWERAEEQSREEEGRRRRKRVKLVFSGGHPGGGVRSRSEAAVMRSLASELLLLPSEGKRITAPAEDWLLEEASTSTWENAVESLEILSHSSSLSSSSSEGEEKEEKEEEEEEEKEALSVSIATSPFHQRRALATFRCAAARRRERGEKEERGEGRRGSPRAAPAFSFSVAVSPRPPPAGPLERCERALEAAREVAAICWYWARGRLCGGG